MAETASSISALRLHIFDRIVNLKIVSANFITSAFDKGGWPKTGMPEIAFAGRSNVGKSSLMNLLLNRQKLVKTSSSPGKTRSINFFEINEKFILTDLPGYGFAKGDKSEIAKWKPMIEEYLSKRETLKALIHIVDVRREPNDLEVMLAEWVRHKNIPHILVANKADKLSKNKCAQSSAIIERILGAKPILSSTLSKQGRNEIWGAITPLLI